MSKLSLLSLQKRHDYEVDIHYAGSQDEIGFKKSGINSIVKFMCNVHCTIFCHRKKVLVSITTIALT